MDWILPALGIGAGVIALIIGVVFAAATASLAFLAVLSQIIEI